MTMGFARRAFLGAFIFALLFAAGDSWADPLYVEESKARIRSGPGTEYDVLWEPPRYTPLEYLAKFKDWYAVRDFQRDVGWVHEGSVARGKAAIVTDSKVNVRKSPDAKAATAFVVEKHYLFLIVESKGAWLKIKDIDGEEGWIQDNQVWISR